MKKRIAGLLMLCVLVVLAACSAGSSPEKVAEKYTRNVYAGDAEAVIKMIYVPEDQQQKTGMQDMLNGKIKAMVAKKKAQVEAAGGVKEITVSSAEYSDNNTRATVKVSTTFKKDEQTDEDRVQLIKTDDGWKIFL